jgi:hypothetical protein
MMIGSDFEQGSLAHRPSVEPEPDGPVEDIVDVLADAEAIVADAAPSVIHDLESERTPWWRRFRRRRGGPDEGEDFRLSSR